MTSIEALKAEVARCREALAKAEAALHEALCTIVGVREGDVVWSEYYEQPALVTDLNFEDSPALTDEERKEYGL